MKTLTIILIVLTVSGILLSFAYNNIIIGGEKMEDKQFQGPVPEGYDLEHFRSTGETKLLENEQ